MHHLVDKGDRAPGLMNRLKHPRLNESHQGLGA